MKRILLLALIVVFSFSLVQSGPVKAQATTQTWSSSITYYTPSDTGGNMVVTYYDGTNLYDSGNIPISGHKAGSIAVGSTTVPSGFKGSAVLSSDVPLIATSVMYAGTNTNQYSRSFYSGFGPSDAGSSFYLATVRSNGVTTSSFGLQNVESFTITATMQFYKVGSTAPAFTYAKDIAPNASYIAKITEVPVYRGNPFDGSLVISAVQKGTSTPANVVATASETQDTGRGIFAYEGTKQGSMEVFSPTATCERGPYTSYFAIQNTSTTTDAAVTIEYYDTAGTKVGTVGPTTVSKGNKLQTNPCLNNLLRNTLGSARVTSTGAPVILIGKYTGSDGLITAFSGSATGATKLAAPYIRWSANPNANYSSNIAVMNVGTAPATNIVARYYDSTGTLRATKALATTNSPLAKYTKVNTNPSTAGALDNTGGFGYSPTTGGALEITSDQPIVALVRLTINPLGIPGVTTLGEDYNMVPVP